MDLCIYQIKKDCRNLIIAMHKMPFRPKSMTPYANIIDINKIMAKID